MAQTPPVTGEGPEAVACPDCGELVTPLGKQSPNMALGQHRWKAHGVAGKKAAAKAKAKAGADAAPEPLALVHSITEPLAKGKGAPTVPQLSAALGRGYGYLMMFRISRLVERDPRLNADQRVEMIERIAPTEQTCEAAASPFARVIARTKLNRTAGRALVDNIDVLDAFVALLETERAIGAYSRELRQVLAGQAAGTVAPLVAAPPPAADTGGGTVPLGAAVPDYYVGAEGPRSPAPTQGVVVDAAMLGVNLGALPPDVNTGVAPREEPPQ